jgi:vitamin B12 transporter
MRALVCGALMAVAVLSVFSEDASSPEAPPIEIGRVDISAEAYSPVALAPAGSVSVVTAKDIEKAGASNAAEALAATPGVWVNRGGYLGSAATTSIGGSSANQVLVIVDGVRLNDSRQGGADLAQIPAESIEKIEVLRGGASAAYGADALGGVIVVTTKKSGERRLSVSVENTSYPTAGAENGAKSYVDGQRLGIEAGTRLGTADVALAAQASREANGYTYDSDGTTATLDNADFRGGAANLSVGLPIAGGRLSALAAASYQDAEVPGSLDYPTPQAEQKDGSLRGSLGWSSDALAGGALVLDVQGHGKFTRLDYADPSYPESDRHDMASGGVDLRAVDSISSALDLGFGGSLLYEAANSTAFEDSPDGQPTRFSLGAYVEPELRVGDRLKIKPALRYDWSDDFIAGLSTMIGAVWKASEAVDLRLSGGRSYRAPTFDELYWPLEDFGSYGSYQGNPDLKPEVAWSGELGCDAKLGPFAASASASARYVSNLIVSSADFASTPVNLDKAFIPDASLEASYRVGPATLKANYEFLYPLDLSNGQTIADGVVIESYSRHKAGGSVDFAFGAIEAGVRLSHWSDRVVSEEDVKGATIVDLSAAYKATKNLRVNVAVDNLFNVDYQVNSGYPMPGVAVKVGAKLYL